MASPKIQDEELLQKLTGVFQTYGYEGASLSRIAEVTGLQRASLYHRFPGGKEEMAEAVLARVDERFASHVLAPLSGSGTPVQRVKRMAERLSEFFGGGQCSCVLDSLSFDTKYHALKDHVAESMEAWMGAMAKVSQDAGLPKKTARLRAEDALGRIQGALVIARGTDDRGPFERMIKELPALLTTKSSS